MKKQRIVIVGSGAAGSHAAFKIRSYANDANITLISKEPHHCYYKYKLTKYLNGSLKKELLFDSRLQNFTEQDITLRLSQRVSKIDRQNRSLYLAHKEKISYDKLLIATGVKPYVPSAYHSFTQHFTLFNNLEDVELLLANQKALKKPLILAGGLTPVQLALALDSMGSKVDYLMFKKRTKIVLGEEQSLEKTVSILKNSGVRYLEDCEIKGIVKKDHGYTVTYTNGSSKSYSIIFSLFGVESNTRLAEESGIECEKGILVDEHFRTNDKYIYAAGDCAQIYNPKLRDYWVNFGWPNAVVQGMIAAKNICGMKVAYDTNQVNVFDVKGERIRFRNWE